MPHLSKIGIENFRIFKDAATFDFTPLTILTGPNSSGKSSLIKLIKLLTESFNSKKNLDELRFQTGSHNLGDFKKALNWDSNSEVLKIKLPFPLDYFAESFDILLEYKQLKNNPVRLNYFKIYNDNRVLIEFYNNPSMLDIVNDQSFIDQLSEVEKSNFQSRKNNLIKNIDYKYLIETAFQQKTEFEAQKNRGNSSFPFGTVLDPPTQEEFNEYLDVYNSAFSNSYNKIHRGKLSNDLLKDITEEDRLYDFFKNNLNVNTSAFYKEEIEKIYKQALNKLQNLTGSYEGYYYPTTMEWLLKTIEDNIEMSFIENDSFELKLSSLGKIVLNEILIDNIKNAIANIEDKFNSIYSLSVTRGDQSRVYYEQGSQEFNSILFQFSSYIQTERKNDEVFNFINKKLQELEIGELKIRRVENTISIVKVKLYETNKEVALSDLGFGYSQIIPILMKIANIAFERRNPDFSDFWEYRSSILLLEEPEANLHPNLQSKLAGVLVDGAKRFNIQFLIETHSEYFIRKIQFLTAKKEMKKEDSQIYYFHHPRKIPEGEEQIKKINIREDGGLTADFGPGFFDEAVNWKFELMRLKKAQNN